MCVGEPFFGEGGESAEFAQDRGGEGKSRSVVLERDVYRICIRHVPQKDERGRSRVSPAFGAKPGEGGELLLLL